MKLVIAEKPSVALELAKVIGATKRCNGYYIGNNYLVSWCIGHLVTLFNCEDYDPAWKQWKKETLPIIPEIFKLKPVKTTKEQFYILKKMMNSDDITSIIEATDAGREGELIFRHVYKLVGCKKPIQRLWINSYTDKDIYEGFQNLQLGVNFEGLYECAFARQQADWIIGINATRAYSIVYGSTLNIGRVQTPVLSMIVSREKDIQAFKKDYYYIAHLKYQNINAVTDKLSKHEAAAISSKIDGKTAYVYSNSIKIKNQNAPTLFDLTLLQKVANGRYGFTADKTLKITQYLYEHKLVTYPRTDSKFINASMKKDTFDLVCALLEIVESNGDDFIPNVDIIIDDDKVSDHHAILPTNNVLNQNENLNSDQKKILDLIIIRTLSAVAPKATFEVCDCIFICEDLQFKMQAKRVLEKGWLAYENNAGTEEDEEALGDTANQDILFTLNEGEKIANVKGDWSEHETSAKKRYTEQTLLSAMETAGKDDFKKIEGAERCGLGTTATRAAIIEGLISHGYIIRKGKQLHPTEKAMMLIDILPAKLKSPTMTAEWEQQIIDIKNGKESRQKFIQRIKQYAIQIVNDVTETDIDTVKFKTEKKIVGSCPMCDGKIIERKTDRGLSWYCSNYKDKNCTFHLYEKTKYFDNILEMTSNRVTDLLNDKKVLFVVKSKNGSIQKRYLKMKINGIYVNFECVGYPKSNKE